MTRISSPPTALTDLTDLIDRRATAWNRLWVAVTGLWLAAIASHLPSILGVLLTIGAVILIAAAAGIIELSLAVWFRYLQEPAMEQRSRLEARAAERDDRRAAEPDDHGAAEEASR